MSAAWEPDDRPEPDELELVYGDLKLAQSEIERLKQRIEQSYEKQTFKEWEANKAEIERLKEENAHFAWRDADKNKLITELCDALGWWALQRDYQPDFAQKLIQRAREATR
jgi:hypothetical protein